MTYEKINFKDQSVENPRTYKVTNISTDVITLTDNFGTVTELGTPINADNMNHIENGIVACYEDLADKNFSNITSTAQSKFDAKANKSFDNITQTGITRIHNIVGYDYSNRISVSYSFTAPSDGLLYVKFLSYGSVGSIKVNGNQVANGSSTGNDGETDSSAQIPLSTGDVVTKSGSGVSTSYFYPVKEV